MSLTEFDTTLQEALQDCGLRELPPKMSANDNRTWLRAIALVMKVGGRRSYVLCENDGGRPSIKKDYGSCAAIVFTEGLFPYEFADKTIVPTFKDDSEIIHYLTKSKYDKAEIEALLKAGDREEINRRINEVALSAQKSKIAEKKRCEEIKNFAQKAKEEKEKKSNGRRKKKENNG